MPEESGSQEVVDVDIVLTFDDGPHHITGNNNYTRQVLDTLKSNPTHSPIRAVFFVETHARDDQDQYFRGKSEQGTIVLQRAIEEEHLVQIHTGYDAIDAHDWDHIERLTKPPGDDFEGGLPQDLTQAKAFISTLSADQSVEFVRPVEGKHNGTVRQKYTDKGLRMVLWHVDSRDSISGQEPPDIRTNLRTGIQGQLELDRTQLVILFHDLDPNTYPRQHLESYIAEIDNTIRTYVLQSEADEDEDDQTKFVPNWDLTRSEIRQLLLDRDWVGGDDPH